MSLRIIITELNRPFSPSMMASHRNPDCERYDKCLDKVIKKNWKSFSCSRCPRFKAYVKERERIKKKFGGYSILQRGYLYEEGVM